MKLQIFILFTFVVLCKSAADDLSEEDELFERRSGGPSCVRSTDCDTHEYCLFNRFRSSVGQCHNKQPDSAYCRKDSECLSDNCFLKTCRAIPFRNIERGVRCKKNDDCHHEQHCENLRCVDKKKIGWCAFDSDCFSNNCKNFRCKYRPPLG